MAVAPLAPEEYSPRRDHANGISRSVPVARHRRRRVPRTADRGSRNAIRRI